MLTPASVLDRVAGWQAADVAPLDGGLTNRAWLVQKNGRKAVLKIDANPRDHPFTPRLQEARIQAAAAAQGLAADVLHADDQVLLTAFIDGDVWTPASLAADANLVEVAQALQRLHALPLTGRAFDPAGAAQRYAAAIDGPDGSLVEHCLEVVRTSGRPESVCCCHNDLVAENIVATPAVKFLDWEYACDNDPYFDLATLVEHHDLGTDQARRLLLAYCGDDSAGQRRRLQAQQRLYRALHWLWLAARPGTSAQELQTVAARLGR